MDETMPTLKEYAEFYRLALRADVCDINTVVRWSDGVIMSVASPPLAFYDLSTSESQPLSVVTSLLINVPGGPNSERPVFMLLGHCYARVQAGGSRAEELLLRLYKMAVPECFPDRVYHTLLSLEDRFWLAHDEIAGTIEQVEVDFVAYLFKFAEHAPALPLTLEAV